MSMGAAAIVCNVVLFAITGVIILTEGVPREARYLVLTLLMLAVPLLSAVVLVRGRAALAGRRADATGSPTITLTRAGAVVCNLILLGASCWETVVQYPYPEGNSIIPFAVLAIGTPIVSLVALLAGGRSAMREKGRTGGGELGRGHTTRG